MSVVRSLGETAALAFNAARGAGRPWGLAEEASWSVRWLAARGMSPLDHLASCLSSDDGLCGVTVGAELSNRAAILDTEFPMVRGPLLIVPFLAHLAELTGDGAEMTVGDATVSVSFSGCRVEGVLPLAGAVRIRPVPMPLIPPGLGSRPPALDPEILGQLQALAERTYAPPTPESRVRGAGSGTETDE